MNWYEALTPYLKGRHSLTCPASSLDSPLTYAMNCEREIRCCSYHGNDRILRLTDVPEPARVIWFGERASYSSHRTCPPYHTGTYCNPITNEDVHELHNGGANYGFFDGHAKWYQLDSTLSPNLWSLDPND